MKFFKKIVVKIGNMVSILLMISPIIILFKKDDINENYWLILLILSICYDFYVYSTILFNEEMEKSKELFFKVSKGKTIESDNDLKKLMWYKVICISVLSDYFGDDFKDN